MLRLVWTCWAGLSVGRAVGAFAKKLRPTFSWPRTLRELLVGRRR